MLSTRIATRVRPTLGFFVRRTRLLSKSSIKRDDTEHTHSGPADAEHDIPHQDSIAGKVLGLQQSCELTKLGLANLTEKVNDSYSELRKDMRDGGRRMDHEISDLRRDMKEGFSRTDSKVKGGFARSDKWMYVLIASFILKGSLDLASAAGLIPNLGSGDGGN